MAEKVYELSRDDVIALLNDRSIPEPENIADQIERYITLNLGDKYVGVVTLVEGFSAYDYDVLQREFDRLGVSVIMLPPQCKVDVEGIITARSWKDGLMDNIYRLKNRLKGAVK